MNLNESTGCRVSFKSPARRGEKNASGDGGNWLRSGGRRRRCGRWKRTTISLRLATGVKQFQFQSAATGASSWPHSASITHRISN